MRFINRNELRQQLLYITYTFIFAVSGALMPPIAIRIPFAFGL